MTELHEQRAQQRSGRDGERLYLTEALRFLDDAAKSWRALAARWTQAGDEDRASAAMAHVQRCELQRRRLLAAMDELEAEAAGSDH